MIVLIESLELSEQAKISWGCLGIPEAYQNGE